MARKTVVRTHLRKGNEVSAHIRTLNKQVSNGSKTPNMVFDSKKSLNVQKLERIIKGLYSEKDFNILDVDKTGGTWIVRQYEFLSKESGMRLNLITIVHDENKILSATDWLLLINKRKPLLRYLRSNLKEDD